MSNSPVWRSRLVRLAAIWIITALVELAAWRFFLRSAFYRDFFLPLTVAVVIIALSASWHVMGRRPRDRRARYRRRRARRRHEAQERARQEQPKPE